jgi:hypothetical protein
MLYPMPCVDNQVPMAEAGRQKGLTPCEGRAREESEAQQEQLHGE